MSIQTEEEEKVKIVNINTKQYKDLLDIYSYKKTNIKSIYRTNHLDLTGINYGNYIKLRYETINQIQAISTDALYLLLYLLAYAYSKEYVQTTLKIIQYNSTFTNVKNTKKALQILHEQGFVYVKEKLDNITQNDVLNILVLYNSDDLYKPKNNGYKPVPVDYINRVLLKLTSDQLAVWTILFTYFRFYIADSSYNKETGQITYYFNPMEYSFPKLEQIGEMINKERHTVKQIIESLATKKLITYAKSKEFIQVNGYGQLLNPNYRYRVNLITRVEYLYYYYYKAPETRDSKEVKRIHNNVKSVLQSSEQNLVKDRDYVYYMYYQTALVYFEKALNKNDTEWYKNKSNLLYAIEKFKNEDITRKKNIIKTKQSEEKESESANF